MDPHEPIVIARIEVGGAPPISASLRATVIPVWAVPLAYILILWIAFSFAIFVAAPHSTWAMREINQPVLRGAGSLGIITLLLTIPACRRYLLLRYRHGLIDALGPEPDTDDAADLEDVDKRLTSFGIAVVNPIHDADAFVTACHIARRAIDGDPTLGRASRLTPVPLLAAGDEARDLDSLAYTILADYGGITDKSLARRLGARGGFLFIAESDTPEMLTVDSARSMFGVLIDGSPHHNRTIIIRRT